MKKRFIVPKKKKRKVKTLFFFLMFIFGIYISFNYLNNNLNKINTKEYIELLLINKKHSILKKIIKRNKFDITTNLLMKTSYKKEKTTPVIKELEPKIYIYNTHQTEEYGISNFLEFSIKPTVMMVNYILEDIFNKNNYKTIVEEKSIKEILNKNNWKYNNSYKASRILLEESYKNNNSLKYFIDIHRDSLSHEKTSIIINEKEYAKIIFLIGLENPNYQKNYDFTKKINDKINKKYPGLSKGIYKKGGVGVNGIYNQDFSPYVILVEIGGIETTTTEVLNTSLAFSECFLEVITEIDD